jgi:hypothetical protein
MLRCEPFGGSMVPHPRFADRTGGVVSTQRVCLPRPSSPPIPCWATPRGLPRPLLCGWRVVHAASGVAACCCTGFAGGAAAGIPRLPAAPPPHPKRAHLAALAAASPSLLCRTTQTLPPRCPGLALVGAPVSDVATVRVRASGAVGVGARQWRAPLPLAPAPAHRFVWQPAPYRRSCVWACGCVRVRAGEGQPRKAAPC